MDVHFAFVNRSCRDSDIHARGDSVRSPVEDEEMEEEESKLNFGF